MNPPRLVFSLKGAPGYVAGHSLSNAEIESIASSTVALILEGADVDDERLLNLAPLSSLRCLDLDDTDITDRSLAVIARFPALEELWLECTRITDVGLESLRSCSTLRFVSVAYTSVTEEAVAALVRAVPGIEVAT
jgi:hypothetical protein